MAIFQDESQDSSCSKSERMVGRSMTNHFHTWILAPLSPDLKFIESLWDVLEETLQSAGLLHCQDFDQKLMHSWWK